MVESSRNRTLVTPAGKQYGEEESAKDSEVGEPEDCRVGSRRGSQPWQDGRDGSTRGPDRESTGASRNCCSCMSLG